LTQLLSQYRFPQAETLPLLTALFSLPPPEGAPPLSFSPQKQKQLTLEALVAWLLEEAERAVVYCAWEDLHWADPSTLEVLTLLLDQVATTRVLALLTFRPEFIPPWGNRSHLSHMSLSRLGRPQVEAMVERVTGGKPLPVEVVQQIVAKTDGVPLFVEELTKTVVESGLVREEDGRYVGAQGSTPIPPLAIPATLQDSLMARLDRLAPVKELAQLGATIGREFSYEILQAVSLLDEAMLQRGLQQLVEAELVYQRGLLPRARYIFKHALIQDTAYQSLLKSRRQQLHQQIAQVLEERFAETVETQPELVAHHYTEAGLIAQAIPYWQRAGKRAIQRSAYVEAMAHLTKGLEVLKVLPDTPEHTQQELLLQTTLAQALTVTKGFSASEVEHAYARALELSQQVGETLQLFPALHGLRAFYVARAEYKVAHKLGKQVLNLAQNLQDPTLLIPAHAGLAPCLWFLGEQVLAREHFEQGIALYDPQEHSSLAFLYGNDPGVYCYGMGAYVLWSLGYLDQALKRAHEALILARRLSHPYTLAYALFHAAMSHQFRKEGKAVQELAEEAIVLSTSHGFSFILTWAMIYRGWALAEQGQREAGIAQMRSALATFQASGGGVGLPIYLILLAEAYGKAAQLAEGLRVLGEALAVTHKTGERPFEPELYRLYGELSLRIGEPETGGTGDKKIPSELRFPVSSPGEAFLKAIEIARMQQARSLELRATMSLARLWQQQGRPKEAHAMLADIYGWFTEGFDTKDLQEAKALLDELSERGR